MTDYDFGEEYVAMRLNQIKEREEKAMAKKIKIEEATDKAQRILHQRHGDRNFGRREYSCWQMLKSHDREYYDELLDDEVYDIMREDL